jgi:hypothetical protein
MADTENGKLEYPCFLFVFSLFVSIIMIFLFGLGLCALEGSFINYDLAIERFDFRPLGV